MSFVGSQGMDRPNLLFYILCFVILFSSFSPGCMQVRPVLAAESNTTFVNVGVVLDLGSLPGKKDLASMSMAIDDFYSSHRNFSTKVTLHPRDSEMDIVGAASAALYLLKKVQVQAIIGPITSSQAKFVAELGNKTQVPILSFSATSPSLSSARTPYFVRTTLNDSSQVGAIAAIVKSFGWREAILIYEDSEYGRGIVPFLVDAFNSIDTRVMYRCVIPANASDELINKELDKMKGMQTRVLVVHMMSARLFPLARAAGLMSKGYVWLATSGLTNVLDTMDSDVLGSMEGMLGVQPYIQKSTSLSEFSARWRERFLRDNPSVTVPPTGPTAFQLWAYDTTWALALAAEKEAKVKYSFRNPPGDSNNSTDLGSLAISENGPQLLAAISSTQFHGISGDFLLVDGQRQSNVYEIVNVVRNRRRSVGFWSPASGITKEMNSKLSNDESFKTGVIWPGDPTNIPRGWEVGKKLVVGIPVKNGFNQFVQIDNGTGQENVTGYCIDVFKAVMNKLDYKVQFKFESFENSSASYDDLVYQVFKQKYDAVVGDVTILSNRSLYVDFTLPYTESGVTMIVPLKKDESKYMWIFLKPFTADLWLASLAFFFFTGFVVWVIEHRINKEFRGPPSQQFGTIFYFAFSTLVFAHKERLESNLSRIVVIIWVFVVLILTSSYTASLTSRLTVQQLQPTVADVGELIKRGDYVGYQDGSFVKGLLTTQLQFDEKKLKNYSTPDQYSEALLKGTKNGGVAAIFDEIPYLKLFLKNHCADFDMVGRIYKTDGFGFVFPRGSPLVSDVSKAILKVTEGDEMSAIEAKWFGNQITSCRGDVNDYSSSSLKFRSFGGLFLITGVVSSLALLIFLVTFFYKEWGGLRAAATAAGTSFWKRLVAWYRHYDDKDWKSYTFRDKYPESVNGTGGSDRNEPATEILASPTSYEGSQSPFSIISNMSDMNFGSSPEVMTSIRLNNPPNVVGSTEEVMASVELSDPPNVVSSQEEVMASLVMSDPPNVVGSPEVWTPVDLSEHDNVVQGGLAS